MRRLIFGGASSLDNFIARSDHAVDWLMWSDEAAEITRSLWRRFDTILMGRKTYEIAAKGGQGGGGSSKVRSFVVSRTMTESPKNVTLIRDDVGSFVRALKAESGKDICLMGGGTLARTLFEENLIDEIGFNIHPLLLGDGVPLFHRMGRQIDLQLKECRQFRNGCVYVAYDVNRAA